MEINVIPPEHAKALRKLLKEGFIYQRMSHHCGFAGNCYHKVDGQWIKRTNCPKCNEVLTWVPFEEAVKRLFDNPKG